MSNTDGLAVDTDQMIDDARSLIEMASELQAEIGSFDGCIQALPGVWQGKGVNELSEVFGEFKGTFDAFQESLNRLGCNVQSSGYEFEDTEERVVQANSRLAD